jgi:hypothetical protein
MVTVRMHTGSEGEADNFSCLLVPYQYDNGTGHVINEVLAT